RPTSPPPEEASKEESMERREFLRATSAVAGGLSAVGGPAAFAQGTATAPSAKPYKLRYACELNWFEKEMSFAQRLDLFKSHGFTAVEYNGLLKHEVAEVEQLRKDLDA